MDCRVNEKSKQLTKLLTFKLTKVTTNARASYLRYITYSPA